MSQSEVIPELKSLYHNITSNQEKWSAPTPGKVPTTKTTAAAATGFGTPFAPLPAPRKVPTTKTTAAAATGFGTPFAPLPANTSDDMRLAFSVLKKPPNKPSNRPSKKTSKKSDKNHTKKNKNPKRPSFKQRSIKPTTPYADIKKIILDIISNFQIILDTYRNIINTIETTSSSKGSKTDNYYNELINLFNVEDYYQLSLKNIINKIMSYDFSDSFKSHLIICTYLHYYIDNNDKLSALDSNVKNNNLIKKNLESIKLSIDLIITKYKSYIINIIEYKQEQEDYNKSFFKIFNKVYENDQNNKIYIYILYLLHNYYIDNLIINKLIIIPPKDFNPKSHDKIN
jgi:hypothetical protein